MREEEERGCARDRKLTLQALDDASLPPTTPTTPPFTLLVIPAPHPPPRAPKSQGSSTRGWEVCAGLALVECMERESKDAGGRLHYDGAAAQLRSRQT